MSLSDIYSSTKGRVSTGLAGLALMGGLAFANPASAHDRFHTLPESPAVEVFAPAASYEFQGPEEFRERYGEEAYRELLDIKTKYRTAMADENYGAIALAQEQVMAYMGDENIDSIKAFVAELQQEGMMYAMKNMSQLQNLASDVQAAMDGNTNGLEEHLETYVPVIQEGVALLQDNVTEFYAENKDFCDRVYSDVKSTLYDHELTRAADEYQTGVFSTVSEQFTDFYTRNKPLFDQIMVDAQASFTDEEFLGDLAKYQNDFADVLVRTIMGEDFAKELDAIDAKVKDLERQEKEAIDALIDRLEKNSIIQQGN